MNPGSAPPLGEPNEEVLALIATLHATGQRLEELTAGEVDTVANRDGRTFVLQRAQEQLRQIDAARQAASLDALAQGEAALHRAQQMAKLAHIITAPDGSFERWSENLPQLLALEPALLPRSAGAWLDLMHPDDRARFRAKAIEAGVSKLGFQLEYRLRRTDGQWIHLRQTVEPLSHEVDAARGARWFSTLQDVTVERQTEQDLRTSELRFRQMADSISDVFYLREADGSRMLYVSAAYARIWGRSCESLYANPASWSDAIHPEDRASTYEKNQQGLLAGKYEFAYRIVRPDGSIRWIETKGFPVHDDAGRVVRIAGTASDITERKQAEEVLGKRAGELERFHRLSVGRELQMVELKKQVNALAKLAGQQPPHDLAFLEPKR